MEKDEGGVPTFKKPIKIPKVALRRVPTPKSEAAKKKSASAPTPTTTSAAALNKRNMKGETMLHRECIKGNVEKVSTVSVID